MMATENSHWRTLARFRPRLGEAAKIGLLERLCSPIALYWFASNIHRADWIAKASSMFHEFSLRERAPLSPRAPPDFFFSRCLAGLLLLSLPGLTHSVKQNLNSCTRIRLSSSPVLRDASPPCYFERRRLGVSSERFFAFLFE